jgi:hypothetical protein
MSGSGLPGQVQRPVCKSNSDLPRAPTRSSSGVRPQLGAERLVKLPGAGCATPSVLNALSTAGRWVLGLRASMFGFHLMRAPRVRMLAKGLYEQNEALAGPYLYL